MHLLIHRCPGSELRLDIGFIHVFSPSKQSIASCIACTSHYSPHFSRPSGDLIAQISAIAIVKEVPTCVTATSCAEWQNGVVAITGHDNGKVCLWGLQNLSADGPSKSIDFSDEGSQQSNFSTQGAVRQLRVMQVLEGVHSEAITAVRVHKDQREIVIGDGSGKLSRWASVRVDELKDKELQDLFLVLGDAAVVVKKGRRRSHLPQDRD